MHSEENMRLILQLSLKKAAEIMFRQRLRKPCSHGPGHQRKERNEEWGWQESLGIYFIPFSRSIREEVAVAVLEET